MTLSFSPVDVLKIDADYFENCRKDIFLFMKREFPKFVGDIDDQELDRRIKFCINTAASFDYINLAALRYFTFLCFFFSPLFFRNKKVKEYLSETRGGDMALKDLVLSMPPQNWLLMKGKTTQVHWERAIKLLEKEMVM